MDRAAHLRVRLDSKAEACFDKSAGRDGDIDDGNMKREVLWESDTREKQSEEIML